MSTTAIISNHLRYLWLKNIRYEKDLNFLKVGKYAIHFLIFKFFKIWFSVYISNVYSLQLIFVSAIRFPCFSCVYFGHPFVKAVDAWKGSVSGQKGQLILRISGQWVQERPQGKNLAGFEAIGFSECKSTNDSLLAFESQWRQFIPNQSFLINN